MTEKTIGTFISDQHTCSCTAYATKNDGKRASVYNVRWMTKAAHDTESVPLVKTTVIESWK